MYRSYNQGLNYLTITSVIVFFLLLGCSSSRLSKFEKRLNKDPLNNSFHGLVVVNTKTGKIIHNTNGEKYFTPASNVKIFTLYTGIHLLPDTLPSLKYTIANDSVYFEGTGDPTWLHPYFKDSTGINFLKEYKALLWHPNNSMEEKFGPGWAWEDFDTYFSPEKTVLPLYGNVLTTSIADEVKVSPQLLYDRVTVKEKSTNREETVNQFYIAPTEQDTLEIPFMTNTSLTVNLLEDVLEKKVSLVDQFPTQAKKVLYGQLADSLYRRMLFKSDNFLAEQILMMASSTLSDTLSTQSAISHMLENDLGDLDHQPRWVDGSGLSRYNLFTPMSMIQVLQKLYAQIPEQRLFQLFPMWDESGTVSVWKDPNTTPYIFAKSGSLGNNYNLSGYLKTKTGKLLIFSFMNNHFKVPTGEIRIEIYETLKSIHETY